MHINSLIFHDNPVKLYPYCHHYFSNQATEAPAIYVVSLKSYNLRSKVKNCEAELEPRGSGSRAQMCDYDTLQL